MTSVQQPIYFERAPSVPPPKEEKSEEPQFSGFIEFSTCGQIALAAPFFSLWMDFVRLGIIAGVMYEVVQV